MKVARWAHSLWVTAYRYSTTHGGRWSGKSYEEGQVHVSDMRQLDGLYVFARQYQKSIEDSNFELVKTIIKDEDWTHLFNIGKTSIYSYESGARATFIGLEKSVDSMKSMHNIRRLWVEQAEKVKREALTAAVSSVRAPGSKVAFTWNPTFEDDPIEDYVNNPTNDTLDNFVNYYDNPFKGPEFDSDYARVKRQTPELLEHIYYGKFRTLAANSPFGSNAIRLSIRPPEVIGSHRIAGVDIAYTEGEDSDYTAYVVGDELGNVLYTGHFKEEDTNKRFATLADGVGDVAYVSVDATEAGGKMVSQSYKAMDIKTHPIIFSRTVKTNLVRYAAKRMSDGRTTFQDKLLESEIVIYNEDPRTGRFGASKPHHDDVATAYLLYLNAVRTFHG